MLNKGEIEINKAVLMHYCSLWKLETQNYTYTFVKAKHDKVLYLIHEILKGVIIK